MGVEIKKVIFICNYAANYGGNFLASLAKLSQNLSIDGIQSIYLFPNIASNKKWEIDLSEYKVIYTEFDESNIEISLKNIIDEHTILHLHFMESLQQLSRLAEFANQYGAKIFFHEHMRRPGFSNYRIKRLVSQIVYNLGGVKRFYHSRLRGIKSIAVSPDVRKDLTKVVPKEQVVLVENAIFTDRLDNFTENSIDSKRHALIMGTDYRRKGVDLAIKAIASSKYVSKIQLDILTHFIDRTEKLIIEDFGEIPNFVNILPVTQNVQDFYHKSFVFLSPSRSEAFGYAVIESAYCGTSVIASDIPGQNVLKVVPYIQWITKEDVDSLASQIDLVYEKEQSQVMLESIENRQFIKEHFAIDNWVTKIKELYTKIK
ncbi:hypothetical protein FC48_GL000335 [Ligilactobacillus murinus DSM 20452 = NBRC 14221]|uniref:Glycosyl transferase family 1 domain-containing protein n=1 Tax=Ligilactobacillus murinus DSM 20452 = NBRC 14221 TaxID=1423772 RepID=A0A0R2B5R4_9LACO|nr:hypothetical protein FC48_GL000335 [Ligilactobacillus murinus DSM 20452 = NBRC 14221]